MTSSARFAADRPILGLDTETLGIGWEHRSPRLVAVASAHRSVVLPAGDAARVRAIIDAHVARDGLFAFHNATFDLHALAAIGVEVPRDRIVDTLVLSAVHAPQRRHGLKQVGQWLLGIEDEHTDALRTAMHRGGWTWADVPLDLPEYAAYAGRDAQLTAAVAQRLLGAGLPPRVIELEHDVLLGPVYDMERTGLLLDSRAVVELISELTVAQDADRIWFAAEGIENPAAIAQVVAVLVERGWTPRALTATGRPKLDEEVLEGISDPIAQRLLAHRRRAKLLATYLGPFIAETRDDDNVVHPSIRTLAARTGRMSISDPPLQTLPATDGTIRRCFRARDGHAFVSVDFDQMELRAAAALSGDRRLRNVLDGRFGDVHARNAAAIFGRPVDTVTEEQRRAGKAVTFATLYGAGPERIATQTGMEPEKAERAVDNFWSAYEGLRQERNRLMDKARRTGTVRLESGRQLPVGPNGAYRALNYLLQGTCAEVLKHALVVMHRSDLAEGLRLPIHDEVLLEVPAEDARDCARLAVQMMTEASEEVIGRPIPASGRVLGDRWDIKE